MTYERFLTDSTYAFFFFVIGVWKVKSHLCGRRRRRFRNLWQHQHCRWWRCLGCGELLSDLRIFRSHIGATSPSLFIQFSFKIFQSTLLFFSPICTSINLSRVRYILNVYTCSFPWDRAESEAAAAWKLQSSYIWKTFRRIRYRLYVCMCVCVSVYARNVCRCLKCVYMCGEWGGAVLLMIFAHTRQTWRYGNVLRQRAMWCENCTRKCVYICVQMRKYAESR